MVPFNKYPYFNSAAMVEHLVTKGMYGCGNPVFSYLAFGKIPENPVVTPSTSVQVVRPSAVNRYLQSVTVNATPTTTGA